MKPYSSSDEIDRGFRRAQEDLYLISGYIGILDREALGVYDMHGFCTLVTTILTTYDYDSRAVVLYYSLYGLCRNRTRTWRTEQREKLIGISMDHGFLVQHLGFYY